jgi:hypothetical protein
MATKTTKKAPAKAPVNKAAAKKTPAKPTAQTTGDERKLTNWQPNPKKAGSASHARYEAYAGSKTVAEFFAAGGTAADLAWDSKRGFVVVVEG